MSNHKTLEYQSTSRRSYSACARGLSLDMDVCVLGVCMIYAGTRGVPVSHCRALGKNTTNLLHCSTLVLSSKLMLCWYNVSRVLDIPVHPDRLHIPSGIREYISALIAGTCPSTYYHHHTINNEFPTIQTIQAKGSR